MKKLFSLLVMVAIVLSLEAQSITKAVSMDTTSAIATNNTLTTFTEVLEDEVTVFEPNESLQHQDVTSYFSLYGILGMRQMSVNDHSIYLRFVDDSPSRDNIETFVRLNPASTAVNLGIGGNLPVDETWMIHGELALFLGGVRGFNLDLGAGYIIEKGNFTIIPTLDLSFISASKYLGDIENNDLFIQFDEVKMYSNVAKVYYENFTTTLKPTVQFYLSDVLPNDLQLFATLGYNLKLGASTASLKFTGFDINDEAVTGFKSLNSSNVREFEVDGLASKQSIFRPNGLVFNIGVAKSFE